MKSEKKTSQLVLGPLCCCEVVQSRPPSSDLVTTEQGNMLQGNSLWIQDLTRGKCILAMELFHTEVHCPISRLDVVSSAVHVDCAFHCK